jgi:hypothetical protein
MVAPVILRAFLTRELQLAGWTGFSAAALPVGPTADDDERSQGDAQWLQV